jgi:hypothetical protein
MTEKFNGTFEELQKYVLITGIPGEWRDLGNHKQYRSRHGAILNWWVSTRTITFQGKFLASKEFETAFNRVSVLDQRQHQKLKTVNAPS